MRNFTSYHPIAVLIYLLCVLLITMFFNVPVLLLLSLAGASCYNLLEEGGGIRRYIPFDLILFVVLALVNPLFIHRGKHVLFFVNHSAITLEALIYGCFMAVMMLAVIQWCRAMTRILTSDKLLYLCGKLTPNLSVVLSMALRYIPLFRIQSLKVSHAQTTMGLYAQEGYLAKTKGSLRIFSIVLTWSLENAVDTANSMRARGYGLRKRSHYHNYRIMVGDVILMSGCFVLTGMVLLISQKGALTYEYYPALGKIPGSRAAWCGYFACGLLVFLPFVIDVKEKMKWKLYRSGI